ncbi:phage tail protein [Gilliamella sp. B2838]|uniref:phage tail protein n=1 Tax=Gilliamella sp. B2838 TaxID=2818020 RepID=UPI002269C140|nr:phage tail protein [Gilliamella sp. B2838]MCX8727489.1 phage tail protein [Gilliamella sp. B2838]
MAVDKFQWKTMGNPKVSDLSNINEISFGDGYTQLSSTGINSTTEEWQLTYMGQQSEVKQVRAFLNSHIIKSFKWTNPYGEEKLYRVVNKSIESEFMGGNVVSLSFKFIQAYAP